MKPVIDGLQFGYDFSDQPTVLSGSAAGAYRYDGHFKRVKSTVNGKIIYNVFDASGTLIHIDNVTDNQQTDLVGRVARITNNVVTYLHPDHLGSAQAGTNASGAIAWREQYTPFGEALQRPPANDDQAGYTGHIQDKATGLTYMQARYYDAALGRFLSVDPVDPVESSDYDLNLYAYVGNDPVNRTDPNGEESACFGSSCGPFPEVTAAQAAGTIADFTPGLSGIRAVGDFIHAPSVLGAVTIAASVADLGGVAKGLSKSSQMAKNVAQGAKGEAAVAAKLGDKVAGRRVTLESSTTGKRSVADIVTKDRGVVEVKTGEATLSPGQKAVQADVEAGRDVIPKGRNAADAGLKPGQPTKMACYTVDRCK